MQYLKVTIYGKVQGVFFREAAKRKARELGLVGFVKNQEDGTVYLEAEGEKKILEKLLAWCYQGSETAEVEKVDYSYSSDLSGFYDFAIKN